MSLSRIDVFSISSAEEKVVQFISGKSRNKDIVYLRMSKSELADYLSVSRATLYRVFDNLQKEGYIKVLGSKIKILGGLKGFLHKLSM